MTTREEAHEKIPKGYVATYGQVAEMAGNKKMSRAVGNALHHNPDPDNIPGYRVVNSKGELSGEFAFGGSGAQANLFLFYITSQKTFRKTYALKSQIIFYSEIIK